MEKIDFGQIKKLPPQQRIKALQELEEEITRLIDDRKKEVEEAENLLEEAQHELRIIEDIETPKAETVDVEKLFRPEEPEEETRREEASLEEITAREPIRVNPENLREYWTTDKLREKTDNIYQSVRRTGFMTTEQEREVKYMSAVADAKEDAARVGDYEPDAFQLEQMKVAKSRLAYLARDQGPGEHYMAR